MATPSKAETLMCQAEIGRRSSRAAIIRSDWIETSAMPLPPEFAGTVYHFRRDGNLYREARRNFQRAAGNCFDIAKKRW